MTEIATFTSPEDHDRVQTFSHSIIRISYRKNDEISTRVAIMKNIESFKNRYKKDGDQEALDEVEKFFDEMNFEEIRNFYNKCVNQKEIAVKEEQTMDKRNDYKNGKVFQTIFATKNNKPFTLYIGGTNAHEFRKIKSFEFENEYYALLKDTLKEQNAYFKYTVEYIDNEIKEKLIPVKDEQLLKLFKFLNL